MAQDVIGPGRDRVLQRRKPHRRGLTDAQCNKFLTALAGNCNVRRSATMTGLAYSTLYDMRRRDPAFAQQWQEALALGYMRLEEAVLAYSLKAVHAIDLDALDEDDEAAAIADAAPDMISPEAIKFAMDVAAKHRSEAKGAAFDKRGRRRATNEETDAALRRKLDALARKVKAQLGEQ